MTWQTVLRIVCMLLLMSSSFQTVETTKGQRRRTIDGPLRISSYMNPLAGAPSLQVIGAGQFELDIVNILAETLNFTYKSILPPDVIGPGVQENGTWNGCMGQIVRKEVDLCVSVSQTFQSFDKQMYTDFITPLMWDDIGMLMPAPTERSKALLIIVTFSGEIWIYLLISVISVTTLLWLSHAYEGYRVPFSRWVLFVAASMSLGERGFVIYGRDNNQYSNVFTLLVFFWGLPAMVLVTLYKAIFFALLTVPQYDYLIGGITDLPDRPDVTVYVVKGTSIDDFFLSQRDGPFKLVGEQLRKHPEQRLLQGEFNRVFDVLSDRSKSVYLAAGLGVCQSLIEIDQKRNNPPRLYRSKASFFPRGRTMIVQKGSPLKHILDKQTLLLQQHGLVDYVSRRRLPIRSTVARSVEHLKRLSNNDLIGGYIVFGLSLGASILSLIAEILWHRAHPHVKLHLTRLNENVKGL